MTENTVNIGKLFARIAKVAQSLGAIKKDKKHPQGYDYFSSDVVMGHLNGLLSDNGLMIIPSVVGTPEVIREHDNSERWLIHYEFTIGDIDGNVFISHWVGEAPLKVRGSNNTTFSDDKSIGKAHTYAYKHWLMKIFMVSTVDSDDLDANVPDTSTGKPQQKQGNQRQSTNQNKSGQGNQDKSKSLDPDDHLGKKDANAPILFQTKPILLVETRPAKKEGDKPYMIAGGFTLFSREPFRKLDYDEDVINQLGVIGNHKLIDDDAFVIVYRKEGNKKIAVKILCLRTQQAYEIK